MTRLVRLLGGLVSLLVLLLMVLSFGVFLRLGTSAGEAFVKGQTTAALSRLFGPAYEVSLGAQRLEMRKQGVLALTWDDVSLRRVDQPDRSSEIGRVSVAIRLLPLVGSSLEFGRLEIERARIDLAAFGEPPSERMRAAPVSAAPDSAAPKVSPTQEPARSRIARVAESAIGTLERQLQALQAYHFDTVAFVDITVEGFAGAFARIPDIHLERAELHRAIDGSLSLYSRIDIGAVPLSIGGAANFQSDGARLTSFSLRSSDVDLGAIFPPAPVADTADERPFGSDASVSLEASMHRQPDTGMAVLGLTLHSSAGHLQLGLNRTNIEPSSLRVEYREGEDRLQILPSPFRFEDVAFDLEGVLEPSTDASGIVDADRFRFRLGSQSILSRVGRPDGEPPLEGTLWIDGGIDPNAQIFEISRLELSTLKGRLTGHAIYRGHSNTDVTSLLVEADQLSAPSVKAFWPFMISGKARTWVLAHVGDEGSVPSGSIRIDVLRSRLGEAFKPHQSSEDSELQLDLDLRDMDLETVGTVPRLFRANGKLQTRGGRTEITVDRADVTDHPDLELGPATVVLQKPPSGNPRDLAIDLEFRAHPGASLGGSGYGEDQGERLDSSPGRPTPRGSYCAGSTTRKLERRGQFGEGRSRPADPRAQADQSGRRDPRHSRSGQRFARRGHRGRAGRSQFPPPLWRKARGRETNRRIGHGQWQEAGRTRAEFERHRWRHDESRAVASVVRNRGSSRPSGRHARSAVHRLEEGGRCSRAALLPTRSGRKQYQPA